MVIATIASLNHVPKALVMAESVRRVYPNATLVLCLLEKEVPKSLVLDTFNVVVTPSSMSVPDLPRFMFRHSALECACALKAWLLLWLMNAYLDTDVFIYLDSDTLVFSPFDELFELLSEASIVVTPHHVNDEREAEAMRDNMFRTLMCGAYNLGFLAIRRSDESERFLHWWHHKLVHFCYVDFTTGLFVDQKWVDLAYSLFDVRPLREPGYNVANWNISQRPLDDSGGTITTAGKPLRFLHFSKIDSGKDMYYFKKYARPTDAIFGLRECYKREVQRHDADGLSRKDWTYGVFYSGERILPNARLKYRENKQLLALNVDPFTLSNDAILAFAK